MYTLINEKTDCIQRCKILDDCWPLKLDSVGSYFMARVEKDGLQPDEWDDWSELARFYKLIKYLQSDDYFQEVESLYFNHYMDGTDAWERGLDHIYRRSITPIDQLN